MDYYKLLTGKIGFLLIISPKIHPAAHISTEGL